MGHEQIKGLPSGWRPIRFFQSILHPRDAVVMCEMGRENFEHEKRYVTWSCNMIEGGCHNGFYSDHPDLARADFYRRVESMN